MAIQNRRGKFTKFDPSRMVPGEWAVVLDEDPSAKDGRSVYICFAAGSVKRMSTHEDMVENVAATIEGSITDIKKRLTEVVEATDAQIKAAEAERVTAEKGRVTAETARVEAEKARVAAEEGRSTAELARVEAEKQRELRQAKNDADQAQNNEAAKALTYHICQPDEYSLDSEGQHNVPTITGKNGIVYWTPVVNKDHEYNRYDEWAWVDGAWELKGESKHVAPVTTDDIDKIVAGQSVTGTRVVDTTGLTYLWAKLGAWAAAKFSAITHKHVTGDVTGLDTALGDKATKAELKTVQDSLGRFNVHGMSKMFEVYGYTVPDDGRRAFQLIFMDENRKGLGFIEASKNGVIYKDL